MPKTNKKKKDARRVISCGDLVRQETAITSTGTRILQKSVAIPLSTQDALVPPVGTKMPTSDVFMDEGGLDSVNSSMSDPAYGFSGGISQDEVPGRVKVKTKAKAKRYADLDNPLLSWKEKHCEVYLDRSFACEGRGRLYTGVCTRCSSIHADYRCIDCLGFGMLCKDCLVSSHSCHPLHRVQVWKGDFFRPTTLRELGIRIRLGHQGGDFCNRPGPYVEDFVVMDEHGIHVVEMVFCGCCEIEPKDQLLEFGLWPASFKEPQTAATFSLLRSFHLMNLKGHIPQSDFYHALERMTNGHGLSAPPNRLAQFMTMVREWRHIKMGKRAGRGHDPTGIGGTPNGGAMVLCRACPQPEINLPLGWEAAPPEIRWLYALIVSIDANFKQKARARPHDHLDPPLGPGMGCFVPNMPYMEEVAKQADQEEISHCVGFSAIWNANTKKSKGLRATGVGSVVCACHGLFRPNGMGDLQKGERYINMDCIFLLSLLGCGLHILFVTYDIACQWSLKFYDRMKERPKEWHLPSQMKVTFKVPKFHLPAHIEKCHAPYALEYTEGVGEVDGEAPERNWSELNCSARSLSMMAAGARFDTTDDICNDWNFEKTIDLANSLMKKLVKGISNLVVYSRAFSAFTEALKHQHATELASWEKQIEQWELKLSKECPYEMPASSITMAKVKKALAEEEFKRTEKAGSDGPASTLSGILIEALEIEEVQRTLAETASLTNLTLHQQTDLQTRRTSLLKRIRRMRENQIAHLPTLNNLVNAISSEITAEKIPLLLPSSFDVRMRASVFPAFVLELEDRLRYAQAFEALSTLRGLLRARTVAYQHSERVVPSQRMFTRLNALRTQIEVKIRTTSSMYRTARNALSVLHGHGEWENVLKVLKAEDVRGIGERVVREEDKETFRVAQERSGVDPKDIERMLRGDAKTLPMIFVDPTLPCNNGKNVNLSWIWYTFGEHGEETTESDVEAMEGASKKEIEASLRVEWCKSRARARRAREEVLLIEEEMRRAIEFCRWKSNWWKNQIGCRSGLESWHAEGLKAYASEQAHVETSRAISWFQQLYGIRERAKAIREWVDNPEKDLEECLNQLPPLEIELDLDHDLDLDVHGSV